MYKKKKIPNVRFIRGVICPYCREIEDPGKIPIEIDNIYSWIQQLNGIVEEVPELAPEELIERINRIKGEMKEIVPEEDFED